MSRLPLVLASASPRRRELLAQIGVIPAHTVSPNIDESAQPGESVSDTVLRLASAKAQHVASQRQAEQTDPAAVLAADTLVVLDDQPLGKPADQDAFLSVLLALAEREHQVLTGVAVVAPGGQMQAQVVSTQVRFGPISRREALAYWRTTEPLDKAGGYAVQGKGARFVEAIRGSYSNVVGLPLYETARMLVAVGVLCE